MSADNAIAILATRDRMWRETEHSWTRLGPVGGPGQDVFRVAHIQGPDEFAAYMDEERHNLGWWMEGAFPFESVKAFLDEAEARVYAHTLAKGYPVLEYGVLLLDARPMNFPGC